MAISEKLCWEVLKLANGNKVPRAWLKGSESDEPPIENAIPLAAIEYNLVLDYQKKEIEDSLYFLQKRGYLIQHGHIGLTKVAMQLSDNALKAIETGHFKKEEEKAFKEALFDLKNPGWLGMKFNLGEVWRRFKKSKGKT